MSDKESESEQPLTDMMKEVFLRPIETPEGAQRLIDEDNGRLSAMEVPESVKKEKPQVDWAAKIKESKPKPREDKLPPMFREEEKSFFSSVSPVKSSPSVSTKQSPPQEPLRKPNIGPKQETPTKSVKSGAEAPQKQKSQWFPGSFLDSGKKDLEAAKKNEAKVQGKKQDPKGVVSPPHVLTERENKSDGKPFSTLHSGNSKKMSKKKEKQLPEMKPAKLSPVKSAPSGPGLLRDLGLSLNKKGSVSKSESHNTTKIDYSAIGGTTSRGGGSSGTPAKAAPPSVPSSAKPPTTTLITPILKQKKGEASSKSGKVEDYKEYQRGRIKKHLLTDEEKEATMESRKTDWQKTPKKQSSGISASSSESEDQRSPSEKKRDDYKIEHSIIWLGLELEEIAIRAYELELAGGQLVREDSKLHFRNIKNHKDGTHSAISLDGENDCYLSDDETQRVLFRQHMIGEYAERKGCKMSMKEIDDFMNLLVWELYWTPAETAIQQDYRAELRYYYSFMCVEALSMHETYDTNMLEMIIEGKDPRVLFDVNPTGNRKRVIHAGGNQMVRDWHDDLTPATLEEKTSEVDQTIVVEEEVEKVEAEDLDVTMVKKEGEEELELDFEPSDDEDHQNINPLEEKCAVPKGAKETKQGRTTQEQKLDDAVAQLTAKKVLRNKILGVLDNDQYSVPDEVRNILEEDTGDNIELRGDVATMWMKDNWRGLRYPPIWLDVEHFANIIPESYDNERYRMMVSIAKDNLRIARARNEKGYRFRAADMVVSQDMTLSLAHLVTQEMKSIIKEVKELLEILQASNETMHESFVITEKTLLNHAVGFKAVASDFNLSSTAKLNTLIELMKSLSLTDDVGDIRTAQNLVEGNPIDNKSEASSMTLKSEMSSVSQDPRVRNQSKKNKKPKSSGYDYHNIVE